MVGRDLYFNTPRLVLSLTVDRRQLFPTLMRESERLGSDHDFLKLQNAGASCASVSWHYMASRCRT